MTHRGWLSRVVLVAVLCCAGSLWAQTGPGRPARNDRQQLPRPIYHVAQQLADASTPQQAQAVQPAGHPLDPALQMARSALDNIQKNVKDYSCMLQKRERIGSRLNEPEYMFIKVRHEPFSVYTFFVAPARLKGQEALYVDGKNGNQLQGHGVGIRKIAGTVSLDPNGALAMQGQRYPITEIGILNLTKRLIEVAESDRQYGECQVEISQNAKIDNRPCTLIQVTHPQPRRNFKFHKAEVFVDNELNIPVRYAAYEWPARAGDPPPLLEEYTYYKIKLNNGFTEADFDVSNSNYSFR